jgi:hypothetical protein
MRARGQISSVPATIVEEVSSIAGTPPIGQHQDCPRAFSHQLSAVGFRKRVPSGVEE